MYIVKYFKILNNKNMKNNLTKLTKTIFTVIILITFTACPKNDDDIKPVIIVGQFTWSEWQQQAGWADYSASNWTPNPEILAALKQEIDLNEISFILFSSNWCLRDCGLYMPRIMKLLGEIGYEKDSILIYGLSRDKLQPEIPVQQYEIKFVPTLVILRNNEVIGSLVIEVPNETWEEDILNIVIE